MIWGILMCIAAFIVSYNIIVHFGFMIWITITAAAFIVSFIIKTFKEYKGA